MVGQPIVSHVPAFLPQCKWKPLQIRLVNWQHTTSNFSLTIEFFRASGGCKVPKKPKSGCKVPKKGGMVQKPMYLKSWGTIRPRLSMYPTGVKKIFI